MSDADKLIEAVARAIHDGLGGNGWAYTNYGGDELKTNKSELEEAARAALSAIEAEGWAVVPMEPTDAMMFDSAGSRQDYRAMLYARPRITGGAE